MNTLDNNFIILYNVIVNNRRFTYITNSIFALGGKIMFNYTNRAGNPAQVDFDINELFDYRVENPTASNKVVAEHFGIAEYQKQAQLRESPEYHEAAAQYAEKEGVELSILACKEVQETVNDGRGSRGGNKGLTKAFKQELGDKVVAFLESKVPEEDQGITNSDWVTENTDRLLESGVYASFEVSERPIPTPKQTAAAKAQANAEEQLQKLKDARNALIAQGVDVSNIPAFQGLDDDEDDIEF